MASTETDPQVKQAFESAAKQLGFKISFNGSIVILDEELKANPDPMKEVEEKVANCGTKEVDPTPVPQSEKCSIGGAQDDVSPLPGLADAIEGSDWKLASFITGSNTSGCTQFTAARNYQLAQSHGHIQNAVHTLKQLTKLKAELGWSVQITSGYRSPEHNACIGGSKTSSHQEGYAVDVVVNGRKHVQAMEQIIDLADSGKLCFNQIIWETKPNSSQGIIHLDFKPAGAKQIKVAESVGGSGPFHGIETKEELHSWAKQFGFAS